jgi:hypothetical protein
MMKSLANLTSNYNKCYCKQDVTMPRSDELETKTNCTLVTLGVLDCLFNKSNMEHFHSLLHTSFEFTS